MREQIPVHIIPKDSPEASLKFWLSQSAEDRLSAVEFLREQYYRVLGLNAPPKLVRKITIRSFKR